MPELIRGKVARILNSREVAINVGSGRGVVVGMRFDVMDTTGGDIKDPDTGEKLGCVDRPKVRVEFSRVQERLSVAITYREEAVNVGGVGFGGGLGSSPALSRVLMPPKWVTRYETLKTREETWENLDEEDSYVKTGDPVVQVLGDLDEREGSEPGDGDEVTVATEPEISH
jgi:hypothetical protein